MDLPSSKGIENLTSLVSKTYQTAYRTNLAFPANLENKHLLFRDSTAKIITQNDIQFSIRCAPALQHKPQKADPDQNDKKPFNPFLPPDPNLKVLELEKHIVVLNKYCILPRHFLLVSKEFESQADDLNEQDISMTWECLTNMERSNERWLAFYNCGEVSGASQQHKHVQFIPLPPGQEFAPFPDNLNKGAKLNDKSLPFQHYISGLPLNKSSATLYRTYRRLLFDMEQLNPEKVSYNFAMTTEWVFLSPRSKDHYIGEGYKIGVNSTGMIGLLLTKSEEESKLLDRIGPLTILSYVGKPWPQQIAIVDA